MLICTVQFSFTTWQVVILSVWNINSWLVQITTKLNINWIYNCTPFVFVVWLNLEWTEYSNWFLQWNENLCAYFWAMKHFDVKWPQIFVFNLSWNKLILLSQLCLSTWSTWIKIAFKPVRISGCHIRKISEFIIECNITRNKKMTAVSMA